MQEKGRTTNVPSSLWTDKSIAEEIAHHESDTDSIPSFSSQLTQVAKEPTYENISVSSFKPTPPPRTPSTESPDESISVVTEETVLFIDEAEPEPEVPELKTPEENDITADPPTDAEETDHEEPALPKLRENLRRWFSRISETTAITTTTTEQENNESEDGGDMLPAAAEAASWAGQVGR